MNRMKNVRARLGLLFFPMLATSMSVQLKLSPLINGPSFLLIHVKVVVDDDHVYDFVPLNPTSQDTMNDLLQLKGVPGQIRMTAGPRQNRPSSSLLAQKAEQFANNYSDTNLHLVYNNCWTFALRMLWELSDGEVRNLQ